MRRAGSGDAGHRPAGSPRWAPRRRLEAPGKRAGVVQGLMGTDGVVVGEVRAQQAAEMTLIEDDDVVQAFTADRADQAFGEGILPGGAWGDEDLVDSHVRDSASEVVTIDRVPIAEHIFGRRFIGKSVEHLASRPHGGWVGGDVDMDEVAAIVAEGEEDKEQAEGEGGDHEEIDGGDLAEMRLKEGAPGRGRPRGAPPHVLGNRELRHIVAEEPKLGLDAAAAPGGILASHAANQVTDLAIDRRAPRGARSWHSAPGEAVNPVTRAEESRGVR